MSLPTITPPAILLPIGLRIFSVRPKASRKRVKWFTCSCRLCLSMIVRLKLEAGRSPLSTQGFSILTLLGQLNGICHTGLLCALWGVQLDMWCRACDHTLITSWRPAWTTSGVFPRASRTVPWITVNPTWLGEPMLKSSVSRVRLSSRSWGVQPVPRLRHLLLQLLDALWREAQLSPSAGFVLR